MGGHKRIELLNKMCRICAKEDIKSIPIFGDDGAKQNIVRKIHACLPINVREDDNFPKQICLTCLYKLDACWAMFVLCKEAQTKIEDALYKLNLQEEEPIDKIIVSVEERLRNLSETYPVCYGQTAVICLAPDPTPAPALPPATVPREAQAVPPSSAGPSEPVMYLAPAPAPPAPTQPSAPAEDIYPQALIQVPQAVNESPVVYQEPKVPKPRPVARQRVPLPKPMPAPATPLRAAPAPLKRKHEDPPSNISGKKLCVYCNKYFTDDIIDHHVSLHLRQTFRTCLDCNKNFRSEEALERHRCESKTESETIDLDPVDDDLIIV